MTTLKLTIMLGPAATIEAAELAMPDMPHCLFGGESIEGWDASEVERVLMLAGEHFRMLIQQGEHEKPPPPPKRLPAEVEQALRAQEAFVVPASADLRGLRPVPGSIMPAGAAPMPALVRDTWGDPTPPERLAIEAASPLLSLRAEVARTIAPEAWVEADASLKKADEVLAVIEKRRAA